MGWRRHRPAVLISATARIEILHALALAAGGREPLPEALERLAADDPLLRPWADRLVPRLRQGEALGSVLRRCRLLSRQEAALLDRARHPAPTLTNLAEGTFQMPWPAVVAVWLPTAAVVTTGLALLTGVVMQQMAFATLNREIGIRIPTVGEHALQWLGLVAAVGLTQVAVSQVRGLRWLLVPPFSGIHRALALVDLHRTARADLPAPRWRRAWAATRLGAHRHRAPAWDLPWRTWWMLTRWRLTEGQRQAVLDLEDPLQRLRGLGLGDPATAQEALRQEADAVRPWVFATLVMYGLLGLGVGFFSPLFNIITAIGGGGF